MQFALEMYCRRSVSLDLSDQSMFCLIETGDLSIISKVALNFLLYWCLCILPKI